MHAAYRSGHVLLGRIHIPVLDIRDYLDPLLDMHHAQQSFATRQRIIDYQGDAGNQIMAQRVTDENNFNLQVSVSRGTEVAVLASSMNQLIRQVRLLLNQLENQVPR